MISLMPTSIIYALLAGDGRELTAFPGWQHPCKEPFAGSRTTPYPPLTWFTATETFAVNAPLKACRRLRTGKDGSSGTGS